MMFFNHQAEAFRTMPIHSQPNSGAIRIMNDQDTVIDDVYNPVRKAGETQKTRNGTSLSEGKVNGDHIRPPLLVI